MPHFGQGNVTVRVFNAFSSEERMERKEKEMRRFEYWLRGVAHLLGLGFKGQTVAVSRYRTCHLHSTLSPPE